MKKVLVIGGCGYLGSRIYDDLSELFLIDSVDLEWFGKTVKNNIHADYKHVTVDLISQYDSIVLLCGPSSEKMCEGDMPGTISNNVNNFARLVDLVNKANKQFIYASSCRVYYGSKKTVSTEEDVNFTSHTPYDISKYFNDVIMNHYPNLEYYGLRLGTVNGYSRNFRRESLINSMACSFKERGFIQISNGNVGRAVLDIEDFVRAIRAILLDGTPEKRGIYNICSFNGTVRSIGEEVSSLLNCLMQDKGDDSNTNLSFSMDTSKFRKAFGFSFFGNVESILKRIHSNYDSMTFTSRTQNVPYGF